MAVRLTALRDILWSLEHDLLQTIDQVTGIKRHVRAPGWDGWPW
jgi:hypothetical protein